jgi:hypothetical protein
MKRQPWFWPVKRFFKRVSGKELWLKTDVNYETLESAGWHYIPGLLGRDSVVYSLGVGDSIDLDMDLIDTRHLIRRSGLRSRNGQPISCSIPGRPRARTEACAFIDVSTDAARSRR